MKFASDIYNKVYHAPEAAEAPTPGGVVDPQPKNDPKQEAPTDSPKQEAAKDINVNINVTSSSEATADPEAQNAGDASGDDVTAPTAESEAL
jgi:hypothetical protein